MVLTTGDSECSENTVVDNGILSRMLFLNSGCLATCVVSECNQVDVVIEIPMTGRPENCV
jgi:hypothetical protein